MRDDEVTIPLTSERARDLLEPFDGDWAAIDPASVIQQRFLRELDDLRAACARHFLENEQDCVATEVIRPRSGGYGWHN